MRDIETDRVRAQIAAIARRGVVYLATEAVTRGVIGLLLLIAARLLDTALFGQLVYMFGLFLLISTIGDAGLSTFLLRATGSGQTSRPLLVQAIQIRLGATLLAGAGAAALLAQRGAPTDLWQAFLIGFCGILLKSPAELTWSVLRGAGLTRSDATARLSSTAVFAVALGLAATRATSSLVPFGLAWLTWGVAALAFTVPVLPSLGSDQSTGGRWSLLRAAWPFAVLAVLGSIYFRVDQIMLGHLSSDAETGVYGAAFLALEALLVIPAALAQASVPSMARAWSERDDAALSTLVSRSRRALELIGFGMAAASVGIAPAAIPYLLGYEYARVVDVWAVLAWTIPVVFISSVHASLISAGPRPQVNTAIALAMVGLNTVSNSFAIPMFGAVGAASTTVATQVIGLVVAAHFIRHYIARTDVLQTCVMATVALLATLAHPYAALGVGLMFLTAGAMVLLRTLRGI